MSALIGMAGRAWFSSCPKAVVSEVQTGPELDNDFANGGVGLTPMKPDGRFGRTALTSGNVQTRINSEHSDPADGGS